MPFLSLLAYLTLAPQTPREKASEFIRTRAVAHHFSGAIAVEEDGRAIFEQAFGLANIPFGVPCRTTTRFQIASITKLFTSVIVNQLAERNKIDLHKTIGVYLPNDKDLAADNVTIEQLLNHTSGLLNFDSDIKSEADALAHGVPQYQMPFTSDELLAKFCSGKLVHEPGKVFDYNNGDYIILGKIVENVTHKSFDEILQKEILTPLQMTNTGMAYQRKVVPNLASAYYSIGPKTPLINNFPNYPENWYAAGGMYSTTGDLMKFAKALYGGKLLNPKSLAQMLKPGLNGYGYGIWVGDQVFGGKHFRNVNRPGRIMGVNCSFYHFNGIGSKKTLDVVILGNTNLTEVDDFSWAIGKYLLE